MRAVVQRVSEAAVRVDDEVVGELAAPGLLVLVGVTHTDGPREASALARKIVGLRILSGELSVGDVPDAAVLVVSQFTLYADTRKGRRPSWSAAAPSAIAEPLVQAVVQDISDAGIEVHTGRFGADMKVSSINDGPFTLTIEV